MAADPRCPLQIAVVGGNHQSSSLAIRDRLFVEETANVEVLQALRQAGILQAVVISTCDRTEVAFVHEDAAAASRLATQVLAAHAGLPVEQLAPALYTLIGEDAVHHLFRVASSLDSQIIGEPHVLGQVKTSHRSAHQAAMTGGELEAVLQAAYVAAKRVRTETGVGQRPVSIASAATEMARRLHGDLARCAALVLGVGEMGQFIAETFAGHGLGHLTVTHPQQARAETAARALGCHLAPYPSLPRCLQDADIVIASLGERRATLTPDLARSVLRQRRYKPIFAIDAAIPGDIDPAVDTIDGVFRYTLVDLERIAMEGRAHRETEVPAALRIIDEAVASFVRDRAERSAVPVLTALHRHFEKARVDALDDAGGDADKATRLLVARLLHRPSQALRALAADGGNDDRGTLERTVGKLFGLGKDGPEDQG